MAMMEPRGDILLHLTEREATGLLEVMRADQRFVHWARETLGVSEEAMADIDAIVEKLTAAMKTKPSEVEYIWEIAGGLDCEVEGCLEDVTWRIGEHLLCLLHGRQGIREAKD